MRRAGVAMFLLGSMALLATLPLPDPNTSDHPAIELIAALLALGAVLVWTMRPHRRWVSRLAVVYWILLVSALMAVERPIEATPFFYLWPMVFSAYFFSRREVAVDLAIMWVTLGLALFVWSVDPTKLDLLMGIGVSVTLTTVVVKLLAEHISAVIGRLAEMASTDYLTGLLNRRTFDAEFLHQIDRARAASFRWRSHCSTSTTSSRSTTGLVTRLEIGHFATSPSYSSTSCAVATRSRGSAARSLP